MSRIVIALFSFLLLVPQGLRAAAQLTTLVTSKVAPSTTSCTAPTPSTTFSTTDTAVYMYFDVTGVNAGDTFIVGFYGPSGQLYTGSGGESDFSAAPSAGEWCYVTNNNPLLIAGYPAATMTGTWTVAIFYNQNYSTAFATGTFTIAGSAPASGTQFTYNGFASTAGLTMVGNAATVSTSDGTVLRLTPATGNQSGAAYNTTPVTLGNNATFSTQFQFRFSNQGGTEPADGIVFVLGTSTKGLGGLGVGMGYQGVSGNSFGIEFDTYNNTGFGLGNDDGNSSNHVSIDTNGNLTNTGLTNVYGNQTCIFATGSNSNTAAGCMSNGDLWTVNISYNGSNLTVTLTDPAKGSSFTAINNYPINLASLLGQNTAYAGFTSGTGAGWENHDIVNWTFANTTQSAACTYSLSASSASVGAAQSTGTVAVTAGTGCTWTATSNAPTWLTTSSAGIGSGTVSYAVTANAGTSSRTGTITVGGQTFTVTQAAAEIFTNFNSSTCNQTGTSQFTLTNTANVTHWGVWYDWSTGQTSVAATAKQGSTTVFSGNLTKGSCDPNQASWCNADAVVNATWPAGAYTVTVSPAQMCANSGSSNQGFVYIYGAWQAAGSCSYTLSPSSASAAAGGGTGSFTVTVTAGTGCTWTATSDVTWITPTISGSTVSYTVQANTSTSSRIGHITAGGQTFTVTQAAAAACSYSISPTSNNMAAQGGSSSISIVVTAGTSCSWTASVSSSASSWLHLGSVTSGTGNGSVNYSADLNTSTVSRTGTIAIANLTFTLTQAGGASATAPSIAQGGIVNAVSNRAGVIAQGSIFTIYGTNLGPAARWAAYQFPIPDTVNGVTVTVTQGSTTLKAYLLYVQAAQINAIMPSSTPLGNVQITVNYNGIPSTPTAATIVKVAFGINSTAYGPGPGIIKNYDGSTNPPLNTASIPAKPGQVEIMVGTGLGPITTPDNQSPPGGNLPVAVQVLVGGQQASVAYNGRAPGNAGQDQINFSVPANAPTGCSVPVQVNAGGTWSNTVRIAISTDGKHCQDSFSPFANLSSTGGNAGTIALIRLKFNGQSIKTGGPLNAALDLGIGAFVKNSPGGDLAYSPLTNLPPPGACSSTITTADQGTATSNIFSFDPTITSTLDAGAQLTVTGGAGGASGTMTQSLGSANPYAGLLGGILNTSSGTTLPPPFLDGGPFTVSGPGGKDVGPFTTNIALTPAITWTNPPSTINRASPLTLTWTGGDSTEVVVIGGSSTDQTSKAYGGFTCVAPAGAHSFTVPVNTLADLIPVGVATSSSGAFGMLLLMPLEPGSMQFTPLPKGLDVGVVFDTTATMQEVQVQ
jgi:uncharacterized protein (TIGR03437 family)